MAETEQDAVVEDLRTRFFRDAEGIYIGAFVDGAAPPEGAIECPAPESAHALWDEVQGAWQEPEQPAPDFSPARFAWLLAFTGLDDVWAALEASLKGSDRAAYASLKAQRSKSQFNLGVTLAMVEQFRPLAEVAAPDADLSEATIRAAWVQAALAEV